MTYYPHFYIHFLRLKSGFEFVEQYIPSDSSVSDAEDRSTTTTTPSAAAAMTKEQDTKPEPMNVDSAPLPDIIGNDG